MTPTEAVALAGYMRAHFPSQPIDDYTADAVSELLEPYPLAACRAAVLRLAKRNHEGDAGKSKWCSPTDVYAEVRRERARNIANDEAIDLGDLDPDDTAAFINRLVERRRMAAEGVPFPPREFPAITRAEVIRELTDAGRPVAEALTDDPTHARAAARRAMQDGKQAAQAKPEPRPAPTAACEAQTTEGGGIVICGEVATGTAAGDLRDYPACADHAAECLPTHTTTDDEETQP